MKIRSFIEENLWGTLLWVTVISLFAGGLVGGLTGYREGLKKRTIIVHTDFNNSESYKLKDSKYTFLDSDISNYICGLSEELGIDSDLPVSILMQENPKFDPDAYHRNINGTCDVGFFQLNDKYLWGTFIPSYWDIDVEFNPYNWKHNTFIALHLIQDLCESLKVEDEVIMAYNCGQGAVMGNKIPSSTYEYLASVKNNLSLLRGIQIED